MALTDRIQQVRAALTSGHFVNEASVSTGAVLPLLHELGWPVFDTHVVAPEYSVEGKRVDFALCHPRSKPRVFVEVKQPGRSEGADKQLFEYAFTQGIQMAVLTDGQEWHFFLPGEQGDYQERRVYKLDLVDRDLAECERRLTRYLSYEAVCSDRAIIDARADYQNVRREREVNETLPVAWLRLVKDQDELLVELLADQVESLCGYKPTPDAVGQFLLNQLRLTVGANAEFPRSGGSTAAAVSPAPRKRETAKPIPPANARMGFTIRGAHFEARNGRDALIKFFEQMIRLDPGFPERFSSLARHGRRRRFLARSRDELYPGRADLAEDFSHEIMPGWWIGTNYGILQIRKIVEMACEVAGLAFGRDVSLDV